MKQDNFSDKAKDWDSNSKVVNNASSIAKLIKENIKLNDSMTLMDFGAGTGLLSSFISDSVNKIVAVDNSPAMLSKLQSKIDNFDCEVEILEKDLSVENIDNKFDGIISSMTIHHLEDTALLFGKFYDMLDENGFIAIADLDSEDGSFHSDNCGVFHFGFDRDKLREIATKVGFKNIKFQLANKINKPSREFSVFLMTAVK